MRGFTGKARELVEKASQEHEVGSLSSADWGLHKSMLLPGDWSEAELETLDLKATMKGRMFQVDTPELFMAVVLYMILVTLVETRKSKMEAGSFAARAAEALKDLTSPAGTSFKHVTTKVLYDYPGHEIYLYKEIFAIAACEVRFSSVRGTLTRAQRSSTSTSASSPKAKAAPSSSSRANGCSGVACSRRSCTCTRGARRRSGTPSWSVYPSATT